MYLQIKYLRFLKQRREGNFLVAFAAGLPSASLTARLLKMGVAWAGSQAYHALFETSTSFKPEIDATNAAITKDSSDKTGDTMAAAIDSGNELGKYRPAEMIDQVQAKFLADNGDSRRKDPLAAKREDAIFNATEGETTLAKGTSTLQALDQADASYQNPDAGYHWIHWGKEDSRAEFENAQYVLPGENLDIGGVAMAKLLRATGDINDAEELTKVSRKTRNQTRPKKQKDKRKSQSKSKD